MLNTISNYLKKLATFINGNGIISSLVASILFTGLVFLISRDRSILTYDVRANIKLFESDDNESFIILRRDSSEVEKDIYFIEVDIWNQGNKGINSADVKQAISLSLTGDIELLPDPILLETHPEVTDARIRYDSLGVDILVSFHYLERGNGIKLKAYYASGSSEPSQVNCSGYIAGGGIIKNFDKTFSQTYAIWIWIMMLIITIVFAYYVSGIIFRNLTKFVDSVIDFKKYRLWNYLLYGLISIPIGYFVLIKYINKIPMWIKEFLEYYFNPQSPFT